MMTAFDYESVPARVWFGAGTVRRVGEAVRAVGGRRALVLSTPTRVADARRLAEAMVRDLGADGVAGVFAEAAMHTPVPVTERAVAAMRETGADCTVAYGGGSTTGLGKAIAYRLDTPQVAVPTTYAGSEVTAILGQTEGGRKTTVKHPAILPELVIYDPELTLDLPLPTTVTSGLNALAHAAEGLYAKDRNPISALLAADGARAVLRALPRVAEAPRDPAARSDALYGAWLCGTVLGMVGMSLHHKLCHTLGGSFDLPHAETHAVILPHAVAYNEAAAAAELRPIAEALGSRSAGEGLHAFARTIGAPMALRDLGLAEADLDRAAAIATANPYWSPRAITRDGIRALLGAAWRGDPPAA